MLGRGAGPAVLVALALMAAACSKADEQAVSPPSRASAPASAPSPEAAVPAPTRPGRPSAEPGSTASLSASQQKQLDKLTECLREHGVRIPTGSSARPSPANDPGRVQKALQDCLPLVPPSPAG